MIQLPPSSSFIMGYRGGHQDDVSRLIAGSDDTQLQHRDYGWLGPGIYFWENDAQKAQEWAIDKARRDSDTMTPAVLGAAIELGNCLDLTDSENLELLSLAFEDMKMGRKDLPKNKSVIYGTKDRTLRYLNCAVIRHLHGLIQETGQKPFDTVRGMFIAEEDDDGCADSSFEFNGKAYTQVAVYNTDCIKGFFHPRNT